MFRSEQDYGFPFIFLIQEEELYQSVKRSRQFRRININIISNKMIQQTKLLA